MSGDEYAAREATGEVHVGGGATTYVAHPGSPDVFGSRARPGTRNVGPDVPESVIRHSGAPWFDQIPSPEHPLHERLAEKAGVPLQSPVPATSVQHVTRNYLDFLAGWWAGWRIERASPVQIGLRVGIPRGPNDSATLALESAKVLGVLTVWADGSIEMEALRLSDQERFLVHSGVLSGPEELAARLSEFVRSCSFPPLPRQ